MPYQTIFDLAWTATTMFGYRVSYICSHPVADRVAVTLCWVPLNVHAALCVFCAIQDASELLTSASLPAGASRRWGRGCAGWKTGLLAFCYRSGAAVHASRHLLGVSVVGSGGAYCIVKAGIWSMSAGYPHRHAHCWSRALEGDMFLVCSGALGPDRGATAAMQDQCAVRHPRPSNGFAARHGRARDARQCDARRHDAM